MGPINDDDETQAVTNCLCTPIDLLTPREKPGTGATSAAFVAVGLFYDREGTPMALCTGHEGGNDSVNPIRSTL